MSKRTVIYLAVFSVLTLTALLTAWYTIDGQPLPETAQYLGGETFAASEGRAAAGCFDRSSPDRRASSSCTGR